MCDKSSPLLVVKDPLEILVYLLATVKGVSFIPLAKFQHGYYSILTQTQLVVLFSTAPRY